MRMSKELIGSERLYSPRWRGFWLWALAGGLLGFCLLAILSVGVFVAPVALGAIALAARFGPRLAEALGALSGIGLLCLAISLLRLADGGDPNPFLWLVVGLGLLLGGMAAFAFGQKKRGVG